MKKNKTLRKGVYLLLIVVLAISHYFTGDRDYEMGKVVNVIDGDTIVLDGNRKVRIIGINTPEIHKKKELYGEEAKAFAEKTLLGKTVYLEKDVSEKDRYQRLLRHVWLVPPDEGNPKEEMYGAMALDQGYAQVYTFPPDVKYESFFLKLSREARENRRGLWALDPDGTTRGERP